MSMWDRPVLVIEDDADMRALLAMSLETEGVTVISASNGAEALPLTRAHRPCLVVLDLMMPVMSGEAFRAAQLADDTIRHIPVIVVSAHYDADKIATSIGAVACLPKPLDFDALMVRVRAIRVASGGKSHVARHALDA